MKMTPDDVVLITGASAGIGAAIAEVYARKGARLALGARRLDRLTEVVPKLEKLGAADVFVQELDVSVQASVDTFVDQVMRRFSHVDILVNNAGLAAGMDPVATGKDADWQAMLDINVYGLLRMTRRLIPEMLRRHKGHIVNMGSIAGFQTYANGAVYAGTKHAVKAITGALRLELNGSPLRVTEIDPGMVETEFSIVRLKDDARAKAVYQGMTPLSAMDIAECVEFATSRSAHVNVDHIVIMPTDQAAVHKLHRHTTS